MKSFVYLHGGGISRIPVVINTAIPQITRIKYPAFKGISSVRLDDCVTWEMQGLDRQGYIRGIWHVGQYTGKYFDGITGVDIEISNRAPPGNLLFVPSDKLHLLTLINRDD